MTTYDWTQILECALKGVQGRFSTNELAYLALTSKIELPFRDRLAFLLYNQFCAETDIVVSREWKRVDLAVLHKSQPEMRPEMLLEIKAMYSFDMQGQTAPNNFPGLIRRDVKKLQKISVHYADKPPAIFTLLLATHPHSSPPKCLDGVIKYAPGIRARTPESTECLKQAVQAHFSGHKFASSVEFLGGEAFGIKVSLCYWLFGPH